MERRVSPTARLALLLVMQVALFLPCTSAAGNTTDGVALLAFKAMISGHASGVLSSWNNTLPYCSWPGITCGRRHPDRVTALDLHSTNLTGTISPSITNLTFIKFIYLAGNSLNGHIPLDIGRLTRLQFLNLSYNALDGEIPTSLSLCSNLRVLHLGANQLQGLIPIGLRNCTELQIVSLRANHLRGGVPIELTELPNLSRLILGSNNLGGAIPPQLGNLSALAILDLAENNLAGEIPDTLGRIIGLGALQICINNLSGPIPTSIYNLSSIWQLNLAQNQLVGTLPEGLGDSFPELVELIIYENKFGGRIPRSLSNASVLVKIELAGNRFTGRVPSNLGVLQNLVEVLLAANQLEDGEATGWSFLTSLTNCSNLQIIDMYDNRLKGSLPGSIANLSTTLWKLSLNKNQIYGGIPEGIGNLVGLTSLNLEENHLTGLIPPEIGKLRNLHVMNISANGFSGEIPPSIGNATLLIRLSMGSNRLVGSIPTSIGRLQDLEVLDLNSNKLTSTIPKEVVSISSLSTYLDLSNNSLSGSLPMEVGNLKNIELLDVSKNNLSGEIPITLGECAIMVYLYMEDNNFKGAIPESLNNLRGLLELDLSSNTLSGRIPSFLAKLQQLQYLNLSFNNLTGEVPRGGVFQNSSAISLKGNTNLCGGDSVLHLQGCAIENSKRRNRFKTIAVITIITCCTVVLLIIMFSLLYVCRRRRLQQSRKALSSVIKSSSMDHQYQKISYSELRLATNSFSSDNLIGVGSFGSVYKGSMNDGKLVAVKVLDLQQQGGSKSFLAECEALRNIRHRNLIKVLTACSSVDARGNEFKALVFEFMPNGSLDDWLHSEGRSLSFIQRLNIAIDLASALDYLHSHGQTPIIHCDIKPSNVLLDNDMSAHLGDFGLSRFLATDASKTAGNQSISIGLRGTIGYLPPEYGMRMNVSIYGDVYSYGILLLEILTGRRPTAELFKDGLSLRNYVGMSFPDNIMEIIDPILKFEVSSRDDDGADDGDRCASNQDERVHLQGYMVKMIGLGLACSKEPQRERMNLNDVYKEMCAMRNAIHDHKDPFKPCG